MHHTFSPKPEKAIPDPYIIPGPRDQEEGDRRTRHSPPVPQVAPGCGLSGFRDSRLQALDL